MHTFSPRALLWQHYVTPSNKLIYNGIFRTITASQNIPVGAKVECSCPSGSTSIFYVHYGYFYKLQHISHYDRLSLDSSSLSLSLPLSLSDFTYPYILSYVHAHTHIPSYTHTDTYTRQTSLTSKPVEQVTLVTPHMGIYCRGAMLFKV